MISLFHSVRDPLSRALRLACAEKKIDLDVMDADAPDAPSNQPVPTLIDSLGREWGVALIIIEYLNEKYPTPDMLGQTPEQRVETRALLLDLADSLYQQVTQPLLIEKVEKPLARRNGDNSITMNSRATRDALLLLNHTALHMGDLYRDRRWLAGNDFSFVDCLMAAHVSLWDLMAVVPWQELSTQAPDFKNWYACVKSRPAFKVLHHDQLPGLKVPSYYSNPDF